MSDFSPLTRSAPARIVQVGAGGMGRAWLRTLAASSDVELVGLVDLDPDVARSAAAEAGFRAVPVATTLSELLGSGTAVDAVLNVTTPAAHHPVSTEALLGGLAVLSEKPVAESVSQTLSMMAAAEVTRQRLMVSQSRRYWATLSALRRQIAELGLPSTLTCDFFKAVHIPGFREEMASPLLVDMSIHHFDLARDLLRREPLSVYCESHNPSGSWFRGDAAAVAVFEFEGGARFNYSGSWCSPGLETSWNGRWRLSAADGAAQWDGDHPPVAERADGEPLPAEVIDEPEEIAGSLAEFVQVWRDGGVAWGDVHSNVLSLAMVEGAIRSAAEQRRVRIAEVLDDAYAEAVRVETSPLVRARLLSWPSVHAVVGRGAGPTLGP
ncbi:MAG TPA: Gfo/Idh/MocA family oxidoreductase [Propionibacteriaceae bacterium]|nr:Gfo/Idh/MocA family oxidoreductase [Propionibacteriaceae bacterium]